jgi:hypothetical protein
MARGLDYQALDLRLAPLRRVARFPGDNPALDRKRAARPAQS